MLQTIARMFRRAVPYGPGGYCDHCGCRARCACVCCND